MGAPKTNLEARKHRASMRNHALEWRQHVTGDCMCWALTEGECSEAKELYLKLAKDYRDMALSAEKPQVGPAPSRGELIF